MTAIRSGSYTHLVGCRRLSSRPARSAGLAPLLRHVLVDGGDPVAAEQGGDVYKRQNLRYKITKVHH